MDLFILYIFVYSLNVAASLDVGTTRQNGPVSSYIGAKKTMKILNYIQKMQDYEKRNPLRTDREEKTTSQDPSMMESMKLLQKNYDTSRKYNNNNVNTRVHLHFISNPEVIDTYRNLPLRRNEDYDIGVDRQRAYADEVKRNGIIEMYKLSKPDELPQDFRKRFEGTKSSTPSSETDNDEDSSSSDDEENNDNVQKNIFQFRVDEDLETSEHSADMSDVTLKPEEAFDIVKPFIVEIFKKLKEKNGKEIEKNEAEDFYDSKKSIHSEEDHAKLIKLNLKDLTTKLPVKFWTRQRDSQEIDVKDNQSLQILTTPDQYEIRNSWRKKEKVKNSNTDENISQKRNNKDSEVYTGQKRTKYRNWKDKKLPASKKSFVAPTFAHDDGWDDKGYGYWKKTNWGEKAKKENISKEKVKNHSSKMNSNENKNYDSTKRNKRKGDKSKELSQYLKGDPDWDKKNEWDIPANKKDDWDKPINKKNDWDKPINKRDDWDKPINKKIDWDKPKNDKVDWDKSKNDKVDWDKPKNDKVDWDRLKSGIDNWDKPKNKNDDLDNSKITNDNDWDKKKFGWDKKEDNWNKKSDSWNKKDDWDKKRDNWNKKKDNWNKKDDDLNEKDTNTGKKLPDNKKRDSAWDLVGFDMNKRSAESQSAKQGSKNRNKHSEWGNYESFRNTKDFSNEKTTYKEKKKDEFKEDLKPTFETEFKPKIKNNWDNYGPKYSNNHDGLKVGNAPFGRTSIPSVGKKAVYAD